MTGTVPASRLRSPRQAGAAQPADRPLVVQIITNLSRGGAQATVMASIDMADHGFDVVVLAGGSPDRGNGSFWDRLGAPSALVPVPHLVRRVAPLEDLKALAWLVRWLRANRPAVVHTHSTKAGVLGRLAAAMADVPCAHTVHGWGTLYSTNRLAVGVAATIERFLAGISQALVVVGEKDVARGLNHRIGRPGQYRVIRSGVDLSAGSAAAGERATIRRELGLSDRYVVGMVARMAHPKDHATLITAFERASIADSTLVLIGDGDERPVIERQVAEAGLGSRVRFLGLRTDAVRLVAAFDLAVLSSRWEGMPRSVVEAAAAGVPVMATDVGNVGDLIDDGVSGRLVPVADADAMASVMIDAVERPVAYRDMARVARRRAAEFSVERMRDQLAELWLQLAATRSPQRDEAGPVGSSPDPEPTRPTGPQAANRQRRRRASPPGRFGSIGGRSGSFRR